MWRFWLGRASLLGGAQVLTNQVAFATCRSQCWKAPPSTAFNMVVNSPLCCSIFPEACMKEYGTHNQSRTLWPRGLWGCCSTQFLLECHVATGLPFQGPDGALGSAVRSSTIQWCLTPLSAPNTCLGGSARVWCVWLAGLPIFIFWPSPPTPQGLYPLGPAWLQYMFYSHG